MSADRQQDDKFESWGLLELFGHQRLAGKLSEQTVGGVHFIRIDVPEIPAQPARSKYDQPSPEQPGYTRFFTQGAIYGMTPTTEDVARRMAYGLRAVPVSQYDVPALPAPALDKRTDLETRGDPFIDDHDPADDAH